MRTLRIATRGSALARWQAEHVRTLLEALDYRCEIEIITTSGDRGNRTPTAEITGKALFTKEIEDALLQNAADLAVHSLKDVAIEMPAGLVLGAVPTRDDPRDAIVSRDGRSLDELLPGSRVGTASIRRRSALRAARQDLEITTLRGNVPTRVRRVTDGDVDAAVLAMAGLRRLQLAEGALPIDSATIVPAPGQGALAIQTREDDPEVQGAVERIDDPAVHAAVLAERAALLGLESGCAVPIGAHCWRNGESLALSVAVYAIDGSRTLQTTLPVDPAVPTEAGRSAAQELERQGANELILAALAAANTEGV